MQNKQRTKKKRRKYCQRLKVRKQKISNHTVKQIDNETKIGLKYKMSIKRKWKDKMRETKSCSVVNLKGRKNCKNNGK